MFNGFNIENSYVTDYTPSMVVFDLAILFSDRKDSEAKLLAFV
jgi:hypothetical protein